MLQLKEYFSIGVTAVARFGIYQMVERYSTQVAKRIPVPPEKRVSLTPFTIRHTTGTYLLCAGVDINTIRAFSATFDDARAAA